VNKSCTKSLRNLEIVRTDVCDVVAAWRERGKKTPAALDDVAEAGIASRRRVQSLFFNETYSPVKSTERSRIRFGVVKMLRRIAEELRRKADHWEHVADLKESAEQQTLWGEENWLHLIQPAQDFVAAQKWAA
jgi:hypothetical protein